MKKRLTFEFKATEDEAIRYCEMINKEQSYYMRKHHPAHYTRWSAQDGSFNGFVCFYHV